MNELQLQTDSLFAAELQFRLASAVRLASSQSRQPLDLPIEWVHGKHRVRYSEVALRQDQGDFAACCLHRTATYMLAMATKEAIRVAIKDPKNSPELAIRGAYQISRLVRNAFAHAPFEPIWAIEADCQATVFEVPDVIRLDTAGLNGQRFDWRHYGGPLALLALARYVRHKVLGVPEQERRIIPLPTNSYFQQGDLVFQRVDGLPETK